MKYLILFINFFLIVSCCSKKCNMHNPESSNTISTAFVCPNGGDCKIEIIKNKGLILKTIDVTDTIYEIIDNPSKMVVKYHYSKDQDKAIFDGGFAETVIFEIDAKDYLKTLVDNELKDAKLFYEKSGGRSKVVLLMVTKGKLDINIKKGSVNLNLNFDTGIDSQQTKNIKVIDGKL